jgi:hypothetical protein
MSIAKCTRNVPYVLERLCDVDEAVRRAAFLYIAGVNVTQLRVRQRVLTLKVGSYCYYLHDNHAIPLSSYSTYCK